MSEEFSLGGIEGGSASVPSLAVISDRVLGTVTNQISLPPPSSWRLYWATVQSDNEAKDNYRSLSRYRVGFRLRLEITWGALDTDERAALVAKINANTNNLIRCWPHEDNTNIYYDCFIADETDLDQYVVGAPIGYQGRLVLIGQRVYEDIPIYGAVADMDYTFITRGFCYADSTQAPGYYDSTDAFSCFADSTTPAADYEADDKISFHDRAVRDIGG